MRPRLPSTAGFPTLPVRGVVPLGKSDLPSGTGTVPLTSILTDTDLNPRAGAGSITQHEIMSCAANVATRLQATLPSERTLLFYAAFSTSAILVAVRLWRRLRHEPTAETSDGVVLPLERRFATSADAALQLVVAHGLGGNDPSQKHHTGDLARSLVLEALELDTLARTVSVLFYTARGHGRSHGWEWRGSAQFQWARLASDMLCVASVVGDRFVALGNSMGSATALLAAMAQPERVAALVLYRPPTGWEARQVRRVALLAKASRLHAALPRWPHHEVLRGAAECNFPSRDDERAWTAIRDTPTLILCHGDDPVHPVATGIALHELLPASELHVAVDLAAAEIEFPSVLAAWLHKMST